MIHDVLLVGARGFGASHLRNLERLSDRARLVAIADPAGPPAEGYGSDVPAYPSLDAALAADVRSDVVIIATPTGTHHSLALAALEAGADVYLEKPPVATMAQFLDLLAAERASGRSVQIGFQSFGSHALEDLAALGRPTSVATWATWSRDAAYWSRSAWAGKRMLNGTPIVDGVVTNPLAHAVATALRIAGARRREDVERIELELFRANDIEADDTSSLRVTLRDGLRVTAALTLASPEQTAPLIEVRTPEVDVLFGYTTDELTYPDGRIEHTGRTDLVEQLFDHREHATALSSPLVEAGAFMTVLEAVRTAPRPAPVPVSEITVLTDRESPLATIDGIQEIVERAARSGALFSEVGAAFAV
ncbi:Gfo/Idh/MocA family oxidoreductase [Microbacterium sp. WCS2018Hpa-23]|uniref:Gfo/Idh/MocA family protein n=1 Tax=Microbacterium sp. WCS2018Hpa-23 TaxID=3073634 RepID=UPI0028833553|nr:Gfo/Idh/MocA family oxidoreductase [Microbacterium sp. WCS2018Hpa-23]